MVPRIKGETVVRVSCYVLLCPTPLEFSSRFARIARTILRFIFVLNEDGFLALNLPACANGYRQVKKKRLQFAIG